MKVLTSFGMAVLGSGIIAITYGLSRFVFGLFLPSIREEMTIAPAMAGIIGALPFLSFVVAILAAPGVMRLAGVRWSGVIATGMAAVGLIIIALASSSLVLAGGVLICGLSTGLSSPVMADAVSRVVAAYLRGRVNAIINAGTSVGIALAMPAVLIWAEAWRSAYTGFAVLSALVALAALLYLPRDEPSATGFERRRVLASVPKAQWYAIARLSTLAGFMGLTSAAYWVFAPDAVMTGGGLGASQAAWMWLAVGIAGLIGAGAGDLIDRFGQFRTHAAGLVLMSIALVLLALLPGRPICALLSAALFGAGYMLLTGFYLVRGIRIMQDTPSIGSIPPLLATSIGQVLGSPLAGWLVGLQGYNTTFLLFAALGIVVAGAGKWLLQGDEQKLRPASLQVPGGR